MLTNISAIQPIFSDNCKVDTTMAKNWKEHISSDPEILFGKTVIKGTRIPVELILEKLALGYTFDDLMKAYPRITATDTQACLLYAADNAKHEKTLAV